MLAGEPGYVRIGDTVADWTLPKNDAWIQSIIDQRGTVYTASPTEGNYWNAVRGEPTIFAREVQQLQVRGMDGKGDYLVPGP